MSLSLLLACLLIPLPAAETALQDAPTQEPAAFQSAEAGFRISCPSASWKIHSSMGGAASYVVLGPAHGDEKARVTARASSGSPDDDAEELLDAIVAPLEGNAAYSEIVRIERQIAGVTARGVQADVEYGGESYHLRFYLLVANGFRYQITLQALVADFDRFQDEFERTVDTFAFIDIAEETKRENELRELAALCGSEIEWMEDWESAARRAKGNRQLVMVVVQSYGGFDIGDQPNVGPFMDPDVVALVRTRYVALRWSSAMDVPFSSQDLYGLSRTTFGQAILLATPGGEVVRETFSMNDRAAYEFLLDGLSGHKGLAGAPDPPRTRADGQHAPEERRRQRLLRHARWCLGAGDLTRAEELMAQGLEAWPESAELHRLRANHLRLQRRGEDSLQALARARQFDDGALEPLLAEDEAVLLARLGRFADAAQRLEALTTKSRSPRALYWLGATRLALGQKQAAEEAWRALTDEHAEDRWAWRAAGHLTSIEFSLGAGLRLDWPEEPLLAATRKLESGRLAVAHAARAREDAIRWLLEAQRDDGSWMCPSELSSLATKIHVFTEAVTAIAGTALLRCGDEAGRTAAGRALEHLLAGWRLRKEHQSESAAYYMDYWPWTDAYEIFFFADCLESGVGDPATLREAIAFLVADLAGKQKSGGGWSYYLSSTIDGARTPADQSISFISAAVVLALLRAEAVGVAVPEEVRDRGLACLEAMRAPNGTFGYMLQHDGSGGLNSTQRPGAAGRGPVCSLALVRGGREDAKELRERLDIFVDHGEELGREQGKVLMHAGADAQGSHYLMFDYATAAEAAAELPGSAHKGFRQPILERVLEARNADGSFTDNPLLGREYATAMALLAFQHLDA